MNILSNSKIRKPLVCDLCKSEFTGAGDTSASAQLCECLHTSIKNARYYEILTQNFNITLNKVELHSKTLRRDITGTELKIGSYYDKIRVEIEASVQEIVRKVMLERQALLDEVEGFQKECEMNFRDSHGYRMDLINYLDNVDSFTKGCKDISVLESGTSVLEAFKEGYSYKIELERKMIQYESFIFNKKVEFVKEPHGTVTHVGNLVKVIDCLEKFRDWLRIDLKQSFFLNLKNGDSIKQPKLLIEEFSNGNLFTVYVYQNADPFGISKVKLVVCNRDGKYLRSLNEHTFMNEFKVYKFKDLILVSLYSEVGKCANLKVFNEELERVEYVEALGGLDGKRVGCLFANENGVYVSCLVEDNEGGHHSVVYALNWDMEYVETCGQNKMMFPFHFPNNIDQIEYHDQKFYFRCSNTITVINEDNGSIMKVLDIPCISDMFIDCSGFFVIYCRDKKKVFYLNLNCDILSENDVGDFPGNLKFYYNKYQRNIFFYDNEEYVLFKMPNQDRVFKNSIHWYLKVNEE